MQTGIESLVLPYGVTVVGIRAFSGCSSLSSISWSNVQKLDTQAFENCSSIHELTIPSTITYISQAFSGAGLTSLTFAVTTGWKKSNTSGDTENGVGVDVSDSTTNATNYKKTNFYLLYR